MIDIDQVRISFGGLHALDGVTLQLGDDIEEGAVYGLIGPNGAGKTTLLNALTGFVGIDSGRVSIAGVDVTGASVHERARLGVVRSFQTVRLIEDESLEDNLAIGMYRFRRGRAVAEMLGLARSQRRHDRKRVADMAATLGFDASDLRRSVTELPFGLRRMAELGRVILSEPRVALLDEPAAGLEQDQRVQLADVLRSLATDQGVTVILTEHDIEFVRRLCRRIAVLDSGVNIAWGEPATVLAQPDVHRAYFGESEDV